MFLSWIAGLLEQISRGGYRWVIGAVTASEVGYRSETNSFHYGVYGKVMLMVLFMTWIVMMVVKEGLFSTFISGSSALHMTNAVVPSSGRPKLSPVPILSKRRRPAEQIACFSSSNRKHKSQLVLSPNSSASLQPPIASPSIPIRITGGIAFVAASQSL
ncbi:hypothetical protein LR48_Vigan983s000600 [Vigna angularis]|uniref:Uncharacterized protein n=1 Tax=Phaseolus angularis TaxID=3914 RepID=A0A0L9THU1_PHAAN|nr:hypothetical protein LR48_Vigan983s000600 [Vigna angularis]